VKIFISYPIIITGLLLSILFSCKKETSNVIPTVKDATIGFITSESAMSQCEVISDGGAPVTSKGVCWNTEKLPTLNNSHTSDGTGINTFVSTITRLLANTTYYLRPYAKNTAGTGYGKEVSFKTLQDSTVTDIDGNVYHTIVIDTQVWLVENLKTTTFLNGDPIPNVPDTAVWRQLSEGAYCNYNNDENYAAKFGRLYNWFSVNDSRKLAPVGWHVPGDSEWNTLVTSLGGYDIAGGKMKTTGTGYWQSPNTGATNEIGFTGMPGGRRYYYDGTFIKMGELGFIWSASEDEVVYGGVGILHYNTAELEGDSYSKPNGMSVRCLKDELNK